MGSVDPRIDPGARERLEARFGAEVKAWFDRLPAVLDALAVRWRLDVRAAIPRGSVSVVVRCQTAGGRAVVLKASPDRARLASEAAALRGWQGVHTPEVIAFDEHLGALLIEAIEPGTPLAVSGKHPDAETLANLLRSLHAGGTPDTSHPTVGRRVAYLFDASAKLYQRHPALTEVVPPALYERGRRHALALAEDSSHGVLLHGDLTPANLLDGGPCRGLVAIDPAPCVGDAAFDAVDLILWQADAPATIDARIERLAAAAGIGASRLREWCAAFAAMTALELASGGVESSSRIEMLTQLS